MVSPRPNSVAPGGPALGHVAEKRPKTSWRRVSSCKCSARSLPPLHHSREETRDWAAHLHDVLQRAPPAHYNPLTPRHKCAVCGVKG